MYGVHGNQAMVWDPFSLGNSFYGSFPKPAWPVQESAVSQLLSNQLLCSSPRKSRQFLFFFLNCLSSESYVTFSVLCLFRIK